MEVKILKEDKNSMDIELGSLTIAEVLRTYLNKEGAKLAAWRREHPTKNPILHIESDNPKKLLKKAISEIEKETDKVTEEFNKLK
jgi:DNA-directed RNA polymerase subunit L|tara:strand:+ start:896 stop:1150 length:255 start_codon:yes stop_codon:yes gene_type:complete